MSQYYLITYQADRKITQQEIADHFNVKVRFHLHTTGKSKFLDFIVIDASDQQQDAKPKDFEYQNVILWLDLLTVKKYQKVNNLAKRRIAEIIYFVK